MIPLATLSSLKINLHDWLKQFNPCLLKPYLGLLTPSGDVKPNVKCTCNDLENALLQADENMYQHKLSTHRQRLKYHA